MQHLAIDETHPPELRSWVESANDPATDFPIQNLPLAVFRRRGTAEVFRGGVAIGEQIVDLAAAVACDVFDGDAAQAAQAATGDSLNALMALGPAASSALRLALSRGLRAGSPARSLLEPCLVAQADAEYTLPCAHRRLHRLLHRHPPRDDGGQAVPPGQPAAAELQVGADRLPRSLVVDRGQRHAVRRPSGQTKGAAEKPLFGPSQKLDYELELGFLIGTGNALGEPIAIDEAERHLFGVALFNDWSARDIQPWEYQPLGPFLSKNFASTLSPWVVTMEALAPFRAAARAAGRRPGSAALPERGARPRARGARHRARGLAADCGDARGGPERGASDPQQYTRGGLLDAGAVGRASHRRAVATCSRGTCSARARCRGPVPIRRVRCWN